MNDDTLIYFGDAVKALGSGRVGGYLVLDGSPETADDDGQFFTPSTYFGQAMKAGTDVLYRHGFRMPSDPLTLKLGNRVVGEVSLSRRELGVWAEGGIDVTDAAIKALYDRVDAGEIGWSSGSVGRRVATRPAAKGTEEILSWPIIEATLSPRCKDRRTRAIAVKALEDIEGGAVAAPGLVERSHRLVADAEELACLYADAASQRQSEGRHLSADKRTACKALADRFARLANAPGAKPDPDLMRTLRLRMLRDRI